jgi:hypothetical protein
MQVNKEVSCSSNLYVDTTANFWICARDETNRLHIA